MYFNIHKHLSAYAKADNKSVVSIFADELNCVDEKHDNYFSIGVHPKNISKITASCLKMTDEYLSKPNVLALGEIGLDKLFPDYEKQKTIFKSLISISENHNKPIIIHSVKASSDILHYRKKHIKNSWIIHGFRGKWKLCKQFINLNCCISLGPYIATTPTDTIIEVIKKIPLESVFFETDESNVKIKDIYNEFAKIRGIDVSELKAQVTKNVSKTFGTMH
jgi:TatD DNase family protein